MFTTGARPKAILSKRHNAAICVKLACLLAALLIVQAVSAQQGAALGPATDRRILRVIIECRDPVLTSRQWADLFALPRPSVEMAGPDAQNGIDFTDFILKEPFRRAFLQIGDTQIEFVQRRDRSLPPAAGRSAAIIGLVVGLADSAAARRMRELNVESRSRAGRNIFLEPAAKLGVTTEWIAVDNAADLKQLFSNVRSTSMDISEAPDKGFRNLAQISIATKNVEAISERWSQLLGISPPKINTSDPDSAQRFRDRHSGDRFTFTNIPFGPIAVEMLYSTGTDGTLVQEFMNLYGEGPQHIALNVDNMDAAVKQFERYGFGLGMVVRSQPSAKINFIQAADKLGVDVELIWRAPGR
jgi:hypothetical protein